MAKLWSLIDDYGDINTLKFSEEGIFIQEYGSRSKTGDYYIIDDVVYCVYVDEYDGSLDCMEFYYLVLPLGDCLYGNNPTLWR